MAYAEMAPLVALVGRAVTLELLLEGRILDAAEAKEKGLVTRVVAGRRRCGRGARDGRTHRRGRPARRALAQEIRAPARRPAPLSAAEQDECFDCFDTEDFRIGYAAFLAKRKPAFRGR